MPIGAQPPHRRGTVGQPYSALNLRLVLAAFGLVTSTIFAVLLFRVGAIGFGWVVVALAVIAAIDLVVVQLRRRARRRSGDTGHSLFE
jgi:Flp pilus assembly protein TadB